MLINKSDKKITVKYNSVELEVEPQGKLDVRDFDISTGQTLPSSFLVPRVEKVVMRKYAGVLEQTETVTAPETRSDFDKEIKARDKKIDELNKQIVVFQKSAEVNSQKISQMAEEINGAQDKERKYRGDIKTLNNKIAEIEEDNDRLYKKFKTNKKELDKEK